MIWSDLFDYNLCWQRQKVKCHRVVKLGQSSQPSTPFVLNRVVARRGKGEEHGKRDLKKCFFNCVSFVLSREPYLYLSTLS